MDYIALTLFILAYLLFVILPHRRTHIAVISAFLLVVTGTLTVPEAFWAINWNVMGIFVGTLLIADLFMESRMPAYLAEIIVDRSKNICWAILFICGLTGFISAFVENVATVLIVAPIALSLAKKLKISPVNILIAIAISSNLQGTATLIGDPPSMLLAGFMKLNFMDFFFYKGKVSIFFFVQIGAIASFFVLHRFFKSEKKKAEFIPVEKVKSWFPTILLVVLIFSLALSSFFDPGFGYLSGIICMAFAFIGGIWDVLVQKGHFTKRIKSLDWETTLFLMGVFVIVGSLAVTGWISVMADFLSALIGKNIFTGFCAIVFISMILSGFIDNVPFLSAMLPISISVADKLAIAPVLFLFGLLIGASLGGNITPIGASANIVSMGILKKEGYNVRFGEFVKIGLPFTLAAVFAASLILWFVWGN